MHITSPRNEVKRSPRPCMCCKREFNSEGKHNRLCWQCKVDTRDVVYFDVPMVRSRTGYRALF